MNSFSAASADAEASSEWQAPPALSEDYSDIIVRTSSDGASAPFPGSGNPPSDRTVSGISAARGWPAAPQPVNGQYAIFYAPLSERLSTVDETGYSSVPKLFTEINVVSLEAAGILSVRIQPFLELSGKGVLVGFLDSGIDYTHPAFRRADGTTRIVRLWDQSDTRGAPPEGILYGTEYTAEDINRALFSGAGASAEAIPRADTTGHGTAVAGIACGSADAGEGFTGAAPESAIAFVRLKPAKQYLRDYFLTPEDAVAYQEDDLMVGVRYLLDCARQLEMPLVICLSLGSSQGGHTGETPFENVLETASLTPGVCAVAGTGNETGLAHHVSGGFSSSASGKKTDVEVLVEQESRGFCVEVWTDASVLFGLGFTSPLGETFSPVLPVYLPAGDQFRTDRSGPGGSVDLSFLLERSRISLTGSVTEAPFSSRVALIRFLEPTPGIWSIHVTSPGSASGLSAEDGVVDAERFHMWLPVSGLVTPGVRFSAPDPDTTLVIPSCAPSVLSVGTYNAYDSSLYPYSGRGYTRSGLIKPDFASPGVRLTCPAAGGTYTSITGSCAACALAAGAAALLLESGLRQEPPRYFSAEEIMDLFLRGTRMVREEQRPDRAWGYGVMNLYEIFDSFRNV